MPERWLQPHVLQMANDQAVGHLPRAHPKGMCPQPVQEPAPLFLTPGTNYGRQMRIPKGHRNAPSAP